MFRLRNAFVGIAGSVAVIAGSMSADAATVSVERGEVLVNKGAGFVPTQSSGELNPGVQIMVRPGGLARIAYSGNCQVRIGPGRVWIVGKTMPCVDGKNFIDFSVGRMNQGAPAAAGTAGSSGAAGGGGGAAAGGGGGGAADGFTTELLAAGILGGGVIAVVVVTQSSKKDKGVSD